MNQPRIQPQIREASAADDTVVLQLRAPTVRLDSNRFMHGAHRLYESRGFVERSPYEGSEIPAELQHLWRFYELCLGSRRPSALEACMAVNDLPAVVPPVIQEFVDATNAADTERFVATFTDDAYLSDWGREFHGPDGVRSWNETDNIGMQSQFELISVLPGSAHGEYTANIMVTSNRFNGTGPFKFELRDGKIASLVLS